MCDYRKMNDVLAHSSGDLWILRLIYGFAVQVHKSIIFPTIFPEGQLSSDPHVTFQATRFLKHATWMDKQIKK